MGLSVGDRLRFSWRNTEHALVGLEFSKLYQSLCFFIEPGVYWHGRVYYCYWEGSNLAKAMETVAEEPWD